MATYLELKNKVAAYLDGDDLMDYISGPTGFINLAMRGFERENTLDYMREVSAAEIGSFQIGTDQYTTTSPVKSIERFCYLDGDNRIQLKPKPIGEIRYFKGFANTPAAPRSYARVGVNVDGTWRLELDARPDKVYQTETELVRYSPMLKEDDDANWLTEQAPEILIFGALLEAEPFIQNDDRIPLWLSKYNKEVSSVVEASNAGMIVTSFNQMFRPR